MDVLQNYTTYQSYYALIKKIEDYPEYDKKRAQKKLKSYIEAHEHAIKKKTKVSTDLSSPKTSDPLPTIVAKHT